MASIILSVLGIYLALGFVFAIAFLFGSGVKKIDPGATGGTWGFRLLILPGTVALWPLMAKRWFAGTPNPPAEQNAHREAASQSKS